ncbi:MAG: lipoyl(octanoyl) transferase LipB [Chromatiaceae bacterium]|nr:lipoyl(octanoyl) transferase LipB [Chromatiaceae bacterium]MBP7983646.1 lipoyl(octanoyl) transferase LipB [Chromatiaceae bacterium]
MSAHAPATSNGLLVIRYLGLCAYETIWQAMRDFTDARDAETPDELWLLQHPAIYTLGQAGRWEHLLDAGRIPVLKVDRGGQVTYHGPGQLIAYLLLDLKRAGLGVKGLVHLLETTVIDILATQGVLAQVRPNAPGVYVAGAKIASLGLRVRRHCSYHGLALNVNLDLEPFSRINPCGYPGLAITRLVDLGVELSLEKIAEELAATLAGRLGRVAMTQA